MTGEGFLRRWSRLKGGGTPPDAATAEDAAGAPSGTQRDVRTQHGQSGAEVPAAGKAALPTLEDAMRLTPDSDYSAFVGQGVDKAVRRLALKKLFANPHFNQPDGLDIYMGDYNRTDPLPAPMLAALRQAQDFLQQAAHPEGETGAVGEQSAASLDETGTEDRRPEGDEA